MYTYMVWQVHTYTCTHTCIYVYVHIYNQLTCLHIYTYKSVRACCSAAPLPPTTSNLYRQGFYYIRVQDLTQELNNVDKVKGWVSYPDWMGYKPKNSKAKSQQMLDYEDARAIVIKLKLTSPKEWYEWSKSGQRPTNIPGKPFVVYRDAGWTSWPDWLRHDNKRTVGGKRKRTTREHPADTDAAKKQQQQGY